MPDRPLTIATYAAGASLMAITLIYVFGPTFFLDNDAAHSSKASRKKGVVGLVNPANDCFINSILQALAGLPELRAYLIREVHRRELDGLDLYSNIYTATKNGDASNGKPVPERLRVSLQQGDVTAGLKEMLDALNERPIYRKTISAQMFIRAVERAFNTRISRSQQDAQEFLQVIIERLADEHSAGRKVRQAMRLPEDGADSHLQQMSQLNDRFDKVVAVEDNLSQYSKDYSLDHESSSSGSNFVSQVEQTNGSNDQGEEAFPMEGQLESQVECSTCKFRPKPSVSSFLMLTLNVPLNGSATTLSNCFDGAFKIEHIEDFKCDRCRIEHALQLNQQQLSKVSLSEKERTALESDRSKLQVALKEDPENPPKDVQLPPLASAPTRPITKHTRISTFPRLLVLHLSRSIWDPHSISSKNMAKVSFPETLPLGSLLERKIYRLLGVVTHKGGHHSGHYESFRRQVLAPPYSTKASMGTEGIYSLRGSPAPSSAASSPQLRSIAITDDTLGSPPTITASSIRTINTFDSEASGQLFDATGESLRAGSKTKAEHTPPLDAIPTPGLPDPPSRAEGSSTASIEPPMPARPTSRREFQRRKKAQAKQQDRWWRISDEKVKECKTVEVLGMQREVYLLFYEMVDD